jgi:hypothetical protein
LSNSTERSIKVPLAPLPSPIADSEPDDPKQKRRPPEDQ